MDFRQAFHTDFYSFFGWILDLLLLAIDIMISLGNRSWSRASVNNDLDCLQHHQ